MHVARLLPFLAALVPLTASADLVFTAHLTTDQEPTINGPTTSGGDPRPTPFGEGVFVLNDAQTALTMDVTIFNIDVTGQQSADTNDNLTNAHIHVLASFASLTGPVRWGFFGAPFNNLSPNDGVVTPFATGVGGRFQATWNADEGQNTTLAAQLPGILAGLAYINFHTVQNPAGEIRGQILQVPEPASLVLVAIALGLAVGNRGARRG